jgi:hypothetical protein
LAVFYPQIVQTAYIEDIGDRVQILGDKPVDIGLRDCGASDTA